MSRNHLQQAISAIKKGDKATGKTILVNLLRADPNDDQAWLWMSEVVDTTKKRRQCLEEALRHNPKNHIAKQELERLINPKKTQINQLNLDHYQKLSNSSRDTLVYLCKRFIIEKAYAVLALDETPTFPILNPDAFLFLIPWEVVPELQPLQPYFDLILFRQTGAGFDVVCLKIYHSKGEPKPINQELLVKVGQACLKYSNTISYGITTPIKIQIIVLFERKETANDIQNLKQVKRIPGRKHVGIQVHAFDKVSGRTIYSSAFLRFTGMHKYAKKLIDDEYQFSEDTSLTELMNSHLEFLPILFGAFVGVVLALIGRYIARDYYTPFLDFLCAFMAIMISIYLPKFKTHSRQQGIWAALGFGIILYSILLFILNYPVSVWYVVYIVILGFWGNFFGVIVEP